jgi:hypothetical protein
VPDPFALPRVSGLMLQRHWRITGAREAADGMLLFGFSTAFIFCVTLEYWPMLAKLSIRKE